MVWRGRVSLKATLRASTVELDALIVTQDPSSDVDGFGGGTVDLASELLG